MGDMWFYSLVLFLSNAVWSFLFFRNRDEVKRLRHDYAKAQEIIREEIIKRSME